MALLDDDFGDFSSALPASNVLPQTSRGESDLLFLDSSLTLSLNGSTSVDNGSLLGSANDVPEFSGLQQWSDINLNFERAGNMAISQTDRTNVDSVSWPTETQPWPAGTGTDDLVALSSHQQTLDSINLAGFASFDMKESEDGFGEFESNMVSSKSHGSAPITEGTLDQVAGMDLPNVADADFAKFTLFPTDDIKPEFGDFHDIQGHTIETTLKLEMVDDEFGDFASHTEIDASLLPTSAGTVSTSASVPSLSTSTGIPSLSTSAGVPSLSTSAGVPSLSTSAGVPSLSPLLCTTTTSAGVPSLSTSAGVPSLSTSAGAPSLSTSTGIPSLSTSAGVPSLSTSAGVPSLSTSTGVPPLSTSAGVPPLSTSAGVPSLSTSAGVPSLSTSAGVPSLSTSASLNYEKATAVVLATAFPSPTTTILCESVGKLESLLDHTPSISICSWQSLQKSVDLTVPLYKWDKSYLQEVYLSSLKMSTLMSGSSDNLLDAFGFDAAQMPSVPQTNLPLHNTEVSLLDLGSPTGAKHLNVDSAVKVSGPQPSLWMDSQLCEVDVTPARKPSLPAAMAPQWTTSPQHRLSASAQTILNSLPDLSFMLMVDLMAV
ncbi:hypothetical protein EMCRGX_G032292 [Ephydatia muelleri]